MILLANGKVITRDSEGTGYLPDGGVVTDGGKIVEVGTTADLKAKYPQAEFVDARGGVIMPGLINALRDGWLLEENEESWNDIPCLRLCVDQTGLQNGKIVSTVWLQQEGGTPLRGEIAVDGEIILTAEFTSFAFYDTIKDPET